MTLSDDEFEGLCLSYGLADLLEDERFSTIRARQLHRAELKSVLETVVPEAASRLTLGEAEELFSARSVPFGRVNTLESVAEDPQVIANEVFVETIHPVAGRLKEVRPAPRFSGTPAVLGHPAPEVGQHSREILEEIGMVDRFDELCAHGIVGGS